MVRDQIAVLDVAHGFFETSVLFALLKLRVFELLGDQVRTAEELGDELGARPETLTRLMNAGVALDLLESSDGSSYRVQDALRSVLLPSGGENYLGDWLRNMEMFRDALSRLDQGVLASGPTVDPRAHIGTNPQETRDFTLAMHNYAVVRGRELASFLDTTGAQTLLDLGCGPGTYAFHLAQANPALELYLLDLPGVLEVAKEVAVRYALPGPVHYLPIDVTSDEPIPGEYDIVLVSNTLHMLGESDSRELLRRLYPTVASGGSLVIQAQFLNNDKMGARWPIFLDLIQLCITPRGRNHTEGETRWWMEEAGFQDVGACPMTLLNTNGYLRGYRT